MKLINEFKCLQKASQHLKSWASVKRACQFDSGSGHHFPQYQIVSPHLGVFSFQYKSREKGSQSGISDTTVTPLIQAYLFTRFFITSGFCSLHQTYRLLKTKLKSNIERRGTLGSTNSHSQF